MQEVKTKKERTKKMYNDIRQEYKKMSDIDN